MSIRQFLGLGLLAVLVVAIIAVNFKNSHEVKGLFDSKTIIQTNASSFPPEEYVVKLVGSKPVELKPSSFDRRYEFTSDYAPYRLFTIKELGDTVYDVAKTKKTFWHGVGSGTSWLQNIGDDSTIVTTVRIKRIG
ncbi:MAG: hypothetical protein AAB432_00995 [Patescibacteria group bacterium]